MLARVLAAAVAMVVLPLPAAAQASPPVLGGRFVDQGKVHGITYKVELTVTNDGREFQLPSFAEYEIGLCSAVDDLASYEQQPAATQIRPSGRFHYQWIRGRFIKGGRVAVGSLSISYYCGNRVPRIPFRARLRGTPNAPTSGKPARCDRATIRYVNRRGSDDAYELSEQGVGCTTAREIVRRWHASCEATAMPAQACSAGGIADCQRITGGVWRRLAGVRCTVAKTPGSAVELEYQKSCEPPPPKDEFSYPLRLWAINLDCATASAFPFDGLQTGEADSPCKDSSGVYHRITCAPFAGFACWLRFAAGAVSSGLYGGCRSLAEQWRAFSFFQYYGI